ncbi:MAG: hypothetical protein [Bacteriophage sp.]|nr:MAG: hypothetical protein [Bacteriophage sp.]
MINLVNSWKKSHKKFTVIIVFIYFIAPIIHRFIDDLNNAGAFGLDKQDAIRGALATAVYIASMIKQSGLLKNIDELKDVDKSNEVKKDE